MSRKTTLLTMGLGVSTLAMSAVALAQTMAVATTDLNMRAGPGPHFEVIGLVPINGEVTVNGCVQGSKWCTVVSGGSEGWVYSDYLTADLSGTEVVLSERYDQVGVPVVTYDGPEAPAGAAAGAVTGAVAGAIVGGPAGAAVGATAGAVIGGAAAAAVPDQVRTYVVSNRLEPVYLDGEVVVGASLPEAVELREIPDYEYRYVYVNNVPVVVEPETRRIVYVVR